jgi:DivIVA domain-containing protein
MIDLASIRNASFSLTPTGYNPEEVDRFLADLADQLEAQPISIEAQPVSVETGPPAPPPLPSMPEARSEADLDGLSGAIDRTIGALDAFVQNELAAVRAASDLEVEEIHRERERLLDEAADAARAHRAEAEWEASRIVAAAEDRKSQADEMVAAAARVQAQVLGQLESARATLGIPAEAPASAEVHPIESPSFRSEQPADPEADEVRDATDAAA